MKFTTKYTPIAIALAALVASPVMAFDGDGDSHDLMVDVKVNARADLGLSVSKYKNDTDVEVERVFDTDRYINVKGDIDVDGLINVESSSASLTNQNQNNYENKTINYLTDNDAQATENGLQGASGNIGLNITAGDNNAQDNSAALSKIDAEFVFAAADSISNQNAERNFYYNKGTINNATLSGNTLRDASGNIAVNISAGNSNLQANSLAASVNSNGTMAEATATSHQTQDHNFTKNEGMIKRVSDTVQVTMQGRLTGTYDGTSDQYGDVYLDNWDGELPHPSGGAVGHTDVDNQVQAQLPDGTPVDTDPAGDGGAFLFNEAGTVTLGGTFTGEVVTTRYIVRPHQNTASLNGDALRGASGNIGVNIAAGTNNLQGNHLAIAAANGGGNGGGGGGE